MARISPHFVLRGAQPRWLAPVALLCAVLGTIVLRKSVV